MVFILATISLAAASFDKNINYEEKETPLFKIRTNQGIGKKLERLECKIKSKFLVGEIFYMQFLFKIDRNENFLWSAPAGTSLCCTKMGTPTSFACCAK